MAATTAPRTLTDVLFEKADLGLCLVAPDGTVVRANAEWLRATGFTEEQVVGANITDLPATRDLALAMHARVRAGHRVEVPRHAQTVAGRETWWEGGIEPVAMEGGTGLLVTLRATRDAPAALDGGAALRVDESTLRGILDATRESIWLFSADGVALAANETALARWRRLPEEIIGLPITEFTPGPLGEARLARIRAVARSGEPLDFEDEREGIRFEHNLYPLLGEGGHVGRVAVFSRDVTQRLRERKRAEAALREGSERLSAILEQLPVAVGVIDADGQFILGNTALQSFGLGRIPSRDPRHRSNWRADDGHGTPLPPHQWPGARALRGEVVNPGIEFRYSGDDGHERWCVVSAVPLQRGGDSGSVGAIVVVQDVTERKRDEEALREADRRKDEFLGMLSHELRNPLAPIRNSTYLLQHAKPGSEQAKRAQLVIERQTDHLTRLVDDLLDVTRVARGKIELRRSRVDLRDVISRAADDFRLMLHDRGVRFHVAIPDEAMWSDADATRITQVVGNLLHNASKFTRKDDEVTLSLEVDGSDATIRVRDSGAGISPELLPHVFDAFVQGERTLARTEGGLGLGLALVKGIAELHGGDVRAESAGEGRGAEFVVRLPLAPRAEAQRAEVARVPASNGRRRVLVVDDNHDTAESLADVLRMLGHAVEVAHDGPAAIERARANPPNVVLCDIGLPGMSGYEVARALRAAAANLQLFALSGYAQPEDVKRAIEAGFDGHLAKPASIADIERLLV